MVSLNADEKYYMNDDFVLFKSGIPSQWYESPFVIDGEEYVNCEQRMMKMKALTFGDADVAEEVMKTTDPKRHKELGRAVKNFDVAKWAEKAYSVVVEANYAKFSQNSELRQYLLSTGDRKFVECAPYDKIWGNGLNITDTLATAESDWPGTNLLGKAIMEVRAMLVAEN